MMVTAWLVSALCGLAVLAYLLGILPAKKRLPGPFFRIPILGDTIAFATSDPARFLFGRFKRYGRVFRLSLLGFDAYVTADPEALRPVLSDEAGLFTMPVQTFNSLMGAYSIQTYKEAHGPWRKLSMAALGGRGLQALIPGVVRVMQAHVAGWAAAGRVEIFGAAKRMGLDLAVDVIAGVDLGTLDLAWFKDEMSTFVAGLYGLPLPLPGSPLAKGLAARERLLAALMPVLEAQHRAFGEEWAANGGSASAVASKLMAAEQPVTMEQAQMLGFFARGHTSLRDAAMTVLHSVMGAGDTTRFALFNTWALLAMSPRVQQAAFEEQQKVVAEYGPELSYQAVGNMPYLDATFRECMRLFPASAGGFRKLTRDLQVGDVTIPAGKTVWYHALLLQTLDPVLWDGATNCDLPKHMDWANNFEDAFRPERWLSEATKPRHFYVFGAGAHLCAGMNLVIVEVKLLLALVVRRFRMQLEVPDMLRRCSLFPYAVPAKGTDGLKLLPRDEPLPLG